MRTVLDQPTRYPQFDGVPLVCVTPGNPLSRGEKSVPCGCVCRGLYSGGGYSNGTVQLCDRHSPPDNA